MKICINAGHCAYKNLDPGACGAYSTEANIVHEVGQLVCSYLQAVGFETIFVQENELEDICDIANGSQSDIFVSIHCNAANGRAKGTETFAYRGSKSGNKLASCIQEQLINTFDRTDRGVKEAGYYVLKYTNMTAVLTELEFIDNPESEDFLNNNIDGLARAIARGITDYLA